MGGVGERGRGGASGPGASAHTTARGSDRGALAIVLHTHMPYVEGFGTWPFGEEWLWEAIVGSYLPLLELFDAGASLTLSLTPVLCDQLEAPGLYERFETFVDQVRRHTHEEDAAGLRRAGEQVLAAEIDRSWGDYERARQALARRGGDLLASLAPHAHWTSAATHAVLPLLATDDGVRLQVQTGVASHRARFGDGWRGGFWLPECAHVRRLEPLLADAGVHATCVELTARYGLGAPEHLRPLRDEAGVTLVPIDRATMDLVWSDGGYPADAAYRDYHHHTIHHHTPWSNDGSAYDHARALARANAHAADFVSRTLERLRGSGAGLPSGGLAVCALDTELLGHWWYEGVAWLGAVVQECSRQGLELVRLDEALERIEPVSAPEQRRAGAGARVRSISPSEGGVGERDRPSSWGANGDLSTWSGPAVAETAFQLREAELKAMALTPRAGRAALRELLALQSSDWAFMLTRGIAAPYARERLEFHRRGLVAALDAPEAGGAGATRNLAAHM
ncbi:MAG TPA: 1,4-alpha-glucan branching protein domain-containing protein [Solirubrobacteraceae bacterium]|jgi:1,4-alpha-glucan branching enzyme|nr:1,4-alpha-glucan branching protein domain-containing protein [Solirubrobacteraceae bacterium]